MSSFYWFDYETFGTHPAWDRPCQFAGMRTDEHLNAIGKPLELYCRQSMDYLPHPMACKVTGLSPQQANARGLSEKQFIQRILEQLGQPGTCSVGYNSIRFDDEFTRHTLFRNFHDAYEHEYKDGNSRWDLLDVVRLTRALRPDGIQWPCNDDGTPSNRLELLSVANDIEHGNAHDALSDVRATIGVARLIRDRQPALFSYAFDNRGKHAVSKLLNTAQPQICLQIAGTIPASRSHLSAILPLSMHTDNRNSVIVLDLHQDPEPLLTMSAEEIAERVFRKSRDITALSDLSERPGLGTVAINKCPVIVPFNTLRPADAERLGMDLEQIREHEVTARKLLESEKKLAEIRDVFSRDWAIDERDVEGTLYSGAFLSRDDKERAAILRDSAPGMITDIAVHFEDKRLTELAWRYLARNYPEHLDDEQCMRWQEHCHERLNDVQSPWLSLAQFNEAMAAVEWNAEDSELKENLIAYANLLKQYAGDKSTTATEQATEHTASTS